MNKVQYNEEIEEDTYNKKLFGSKFINFFHESRYLWVKEHLLRNKKNLRMIELGCMDARILNYFPIDTIDYYYGINSGLGIQTKNAIEKHKDNNSINFLTSPNVDDISTENADVLLAMQVFEYIPDDEYRQYFETFSKAGCKDFYITCSNERGPFMLIKILIKKLLKKDVASYSLKEMGHLLFGRMDKIERKPGSMKGFDYKYLVNQIGQEYEVKETVGLPFKFLPAALNFTVAIHAKRK
jgi:hypothetical protein